MSKAVKKVVLAYRAGRHLDHPEMLQTTYGLRGRHLTADLGQGEELAPRTRQGTLAGIKSENQHHRDLREDSCGLRFPMFAPTAVYEGPVPCSVTSIARGP